MRNSRATSNPDDEPIMRTPTANRKTWLILAGVLGCAVVSVSIVSANFLPDQTWGALNAAKTLYAEAVSWMIPVPTGADRSAEEERIYEAALRHLLQSNTYKRQIYLGINGKDPSDEFMRRFAESNLAVKKVSTFRGWFNSSLGERSIVLMVSSIKWSAGDRVEVKGGITCGPLCGSGGVYELVKDRWLWMVESYRKQWDS